ncbi:MAG: type 4a pilus biogenesis protein PilO [Planctomycetota bacterium]|nr:type 4a pilus biogenesis protein PilO [Planctomycetota bacterium]
MNTRREQVLTLLTLAGLTIAFIAAVALPGRQARAALQAEIAASKSEIEQGPIVLDRFRAARKSLDRRREYLDASSAAVAEPHDLLHAISHVAQTSGFAVVRIEPLPVRTQATYVEHPFQLDFRAKLGALTRFLRGLEKSTRLYVIEDVTVRKQATQKESEVLEGTIRFVVYAASTGSGTLAEENDNTGGR